LAQAFLLKGPTLLGAGVSQVWAVCVSWGEPSRLWRADTMPSGQLMTMPILIVNMGGEMVYILEQRLQAQKIPDNKGQKVLNDVVRTMYYPRFIEELFKPQEMYSIHSTRQIFDRLAHSSIMRLNESSMDKLFDLMAMGFKYQIISCTAPQEMVDVTLNHLNALKRLVVSAPQLLELLEECTKQIHTIYSAMLVSDFNSMRQSLCTFFQDRKVKVSLFLHDHTQNHDGSIVVSATGTLAAGCFSPGTVRYFQGGAEIRRDALPCVTTPNWRASLGARTSLGANLYEKDRPADGSAAAGVPPAPLAPAAPGSIPAAPLPEASSMAPQDSRGTASAVGELKLLASLIGGAPAPSNDTFKLENLFGAGVFSKDPKSPGAEIIEIDGSAPSDHRRGLDSIGQQFDNLNLGAAPYDAAQDDLLDLLDRS